MRILSEPILTALATTMLLTSIFALKFRYWNRPKLLVAYFILFGIVEFVCHYHFIPRGALGLGLAYLFFFLTIPVVGAIILLSRLEEKAGQTRG